MSKELNRLCQSLGQFQIEIKPEEVQSPNRAVATRVLEAFASSAFAINNEALHQPLACLLESHNPNTAVQPITQNRLIIFNRALRLMGKGGNQFSIMDIIKPESKKFNQMLQAMLKYMFHYVRVHETVSEVAVKYDEAALEVEELRRQLESADAVLQTNQLKLQSLEAERIPEKLESITEKKNKLELDTQAMKQEYSDTKSVLESVQVEYEEILGTLTKKQEQLRDLQEMVLDDPATFIEHFNDMQKVLSSKEENVALKERQMSELNAKLEQLGDTKKRADELLECANVLAAATEEHQQNKVIFENIQTRDTKHLQSLRNELKNMQSSIESLEDATKQLEDREKQLLDEARQLENDHTAENRKLEKIKNSKIPIQVGIDNRNNELQAVNQEIVEIRSRTSQWAEKKFEEGMHRWNQHEKEAALFEEEYNLCNEDIENRQALLLKLQKQIENFL